MAGGGIQGAGGVFEQFAIWGVLMQVVGPILAPIVQQIADETFPRLPSTPLSAELAADLVLKGWMTAEEGWQEAATTGVNQQRFQQMVNDAGEPIALEQILEAFRRGFIGWDTDNIDGTSVLVGIKQSRVRDQWANVIQQLATIVIPVGDAVSAVVKGQIPFATGQQIAGFSGLSAADFQTLVNTAGNPPGPGELITLARRGVIPVDGLGAGVLSMHQGIIEGLTKDKWWPGILALMEYRPPPRTITALERAGVMPPAQAQTLYQQSGLTPQLAALYSADASAVKLVKTKELAEGTVLNIYRAGVIPESEAAALLGTLGYTAQETAWILAWEDLHRELAAMNSAVTKVSSLYISRKIGQNTAQSMLATLGLPAGQVTQLLDTWLLERDATVKLLTAAEIGDAVKYAIMDQATGQAALEALGFTPYDAWVRLSLSNLAALPNPPPVPTEPTGQLP
jgi:hypothetical protein